jgi:hypothetical protein
MGFEQPIAIALDSSSIKQAARLASMHRRAILKQLLLERPIAFWLMIDHFSEKYFINQKARCIPIRHIDSPIAAITLRS